MSFLTHDFLFSQVANMEPGTEELRRSMPKAIAIPSHDWGVEGNFCLLSVRNTKMTYLQPEMLRWSTLMLVSSLLGNLCGYP